MPEEDGILLSVSRMRNILEIDEENRTALVEPGVVNLELSDEIAHLGLYYAPRSIEPEGLYAWRQRCGELRRSALLALRMYHQ